MRAYSTVFGFLVLLLASSVGGAGEATFDGKDAKWWAARLASEDPGLEKAKAMVALSRGGAKAVPVLAEILGGRDGNFAELEAEAILTGLALLDDAAAPVLVRSLLPHFRNGRSEVMVVTEILKIVAVRHPEHRASMRQELRDLIPKIDHTLGRALAKDLLLALADDTDEHLRKMVKSLVAGEDEGLAIRYLMNRRERALPLILEALPDATIDDLPFVIDVLVDMDTPAVDLYPALLPFAEKGAPLAREVLLGSCGEPGVTFDQRRRLFRMHAGQVKERMQVLAAMKGDAGKAAAFAAFVAETFAEKSLRPEVRVALTRLAMRLGPARAKPLLPRAIEGMADEDSRVRSASAGLIGVIGPPAAEKALPLLGAGLTDSSSMVPPACAIALTRMGPAGLMRLERAMNDGDPVLRRAVATGLGAAMEPAREKAIALLATALADDDETVRRQAAMSIGEFGVAGAPAVPTLIRRLTEEKKPLLRILIAETLGGIGPPAKAAIPALEAAAKDEADWRLAATAERALKRIRKE